MRRMVIVTLTDWRLFSAFLHETKPLKLRKAAIDNLPGFRSESGYLTKPNRFLKEVFLPQHNAASRPRRGPGHRLRPLHRRARRHPVHPRGTHRLKRQHGALQAPGTSDPRRPPPPPLRQGQGPRPRIPRRHNGRLPWTAMSGAIPRRWPTYRQPNPRGRVTRFDATDRRPVDKWTAAPRTDHFPTGPETATEAVNSYGT